MLPYLTTPGKWVLALGMMFLIAAMAMNEPGFILLAGIHIAFIVSGIVLIVPSLMAMESRTVILKLSQKISEGGHEQTESLNYSEVSVGEDGQLWISVENRSGLPLWIESLQAYGSRPLTFNVPRRTHHSISLHAGVSFPMAVRSARLGRWALQGFDVVLRDPLGLFHLRDFIPCSHIFECYPSKRQVGANTRRPTRSLSSQMSSPGRFSEQIHGERTALFRELRQYQHGDSLRELSWKATLRAQKLMVRDYEPARRGNALILFDVSSSMRTGSVAPLKWDRAVLKALEGIEEARSAHVDMGLMVFADKVYTHVAPSNNLMTLSRMRRILIGLSASWHPDFTELDDAEIIDFLTTYLLIHERLDFGKQPHGNFAHDALDAANLLDIWLRQTIAREEPLYRGSLFDDQLDRGLTLARRFLQLRGVEVPHRAETRLGTKERQIVQAIDAAIHAEGSSLHHIVVISDMYGVNQGDMIKRVLQVLRRKSIRLSIVIPVADNVARRNPGDDPQANLVEHLFDIAETREFRRMLRALKELGVPVEIV